MNEENKSPEKAPVDDGRKNALLRYIAILFAVAFLFVLLSLMMQMRDSRATISELSAASASALKNAESLQDNNRQLQEENDALKEALQEAQDQAEALQEQLDEADALRQEAVEQQKKADAEEAEAIRSDYETLLEALDTVTPGSQEGNVSASKLLDNLELLQEHLGARGQQAYQSLLEGE